MSSNIKLRFSSALLKYINIVGFAQFLKARHLLCNHFDTVDFCFVLLPCFYMTFRALKNCFNHIHQLQIYQSNIIKYELHTMFQISLKTPSSGQFFQHYLLILNKYSRLLSLAPAWILPPDEEHHRNPEDQRQHLGQQIISEQLCPWTGAG